MRALRRLVAVVLLPIATGFLLAYLVIPAVWLAFAGQVVVTIGTVGTLVPAAIIGLRMLQAIPKNGTQRLPFFDDFLQGIAQEPQRWHYWSLIGGLALILAGSVMSSVASWPTP